MLVAVPGDCFTAKKKQGFVDSGLRIVFAGSSVLAHLVEDGGSVDEIREVLARCRFPSRWGMQGSQGCWLNKVSAQ